jgi:hypothetical protein
MQRSPALAKAKSSLFAEVFLGTSEDALALHRQVEAGSLRRITKGLYTTNLSDELDAVVARNLWRIVDLLVPGAVVAYRTAFEMRPAKGRIYLSGRGRNAIELPGLEIRISKGPGPLPGDTSYLANLYLASRPRALLECLKPTRARGGVARGLDRATIEEYLDRELRISGESRLNLLRDGARALASSLGAEHEFETLDGIIGALLGTRKTSLSSPVAVARAAGEPYDPQRLDFFQTLHAALVQRSVRPRPDVLPTDNCFANIAFFDAYFSNFIEGTRFKVDEARAIVFDGEIPAARPRDAHDVLGTYHLVGNRAAMSRGVRDIEAVEDFLDRLSAAHAEILGARPDKRPGQFKDEANQAGQTTFVSPELVRGTLRHGITMARSLELPFARAAMMMFVLSEVHPFDDGNGRVARALMNAELVSGGQRRILIPISFRGEYLTGLRALSRQGHADAYLEVLDYAQEYAWRIDFSDYERAVAMLTDTGAFDEAEGQSTFAAADGDAGREAKLRLPGVPHTCSKSFSPSSSSRSV